MPRAHVVIVGGGPGGAVAARVLADRGVAVTVVEAASGARAKAGESLAPNTRPLIERLGLLSAFDDPRVASPCFGVQAVGRYRVAEFPFIASRYGHGWRVNRAGFETLLAGMAVASGVTWHWHWRARAVARRASGGWRLQGRSASGDDVELEADALIDASGRSSWLSRRLGAVRIRLDRQVAVWQRYGRDQVRPSDLDRWITIEAVPEGWWYACRLYHDALGVMLFTLPELLAPTQLRAPDVWQAALDGTTQTAARLIPSATPLGEAVMTDASSSYLDRFTGEGWLAVGDAAVAFDPLSSQGLSNALVSGFYAGHALADDLAGKPGAMDAYEHVVAEGYDAYLGELPAAYARFGEACLGLFWQERLCWAASFKSP